MADIRAMLRNELAARRSASSQLQSSKKRKYEITPSDGRTSSSAPPKSDEELRKRQRSGAHPVIDGIGAGDERGNSMIGVEEGEAGPQVDESAAATDSEGGVSMPVEGGSHATLSEAVAPADAAIMDDEWALFEQEVIAPTKQPDAAIMTQPHAFTSIHTSRQTNPAAVISAPAVTANEIARQEAIEVENENKRRELEKQRDEMLKGEKEDAERFLEEEFDEMDRLEERLRRLRERREELERKRLEGKAGTEDMEGVIETSKKDGEESDGEDEEDEGEEWDEWGFGR
ncbi:hypothetical protein KEM54_000002 [Ascosphaera aggregata]|nr:hypothetical protein KEM54_000002 [Ascosphaera aggregata]